MLKQRAIVAYLTHFINALIGFASVTIVGRLMGAQALGIVATAVAFVNMFTIVGNLGFNIAHVKKVSEEKNIAECFSVYLVVKVATTLLMVGLCILVFHAMEWSFGKTILEKQYSHIFYIILGVSAITNINSIFTDTFAGKLETAKQSIGLFVQKAVTSGLRITVAFIGFGVTYLAVSNLIASFSTFIVLYLLFRPIPKFRFNWTLFQEYRNFALPSAFVSLTAIFFTNIDKVFIGFYSSPKEVGYYTVSFSLVMILSQVGRTVNNLFMPKFSNLFIQKQFHQIRQMSNQAEKYISLISLPLTLFIVLFSKQIILFIFGEEFSRSSFILSILAINFLYFNLSKPYSSQIIASGKVKTAFYLDFSMLSLNIIFNIVFIPESVFSIPLFNLGSHGAALALLLSTIVGYTFFRIAAYRISHAKPSIAVLYHLIIGLPVFFLMKYWFLYSRWQNEWLIVVPCITGLLLYFILCRLTKVISKNDIAYLMEFTQVKSYRKYISEELSSDSHLNEE